MEKRRYFKVTEETEVISLSELLDKMHEEDGIFVEEHWEKQAMIVTATCKFFPERKKCLLVVVPLICHDEKDVDFWLYSPEFGCCDVILGGFPFEPFNEETFHFPGGMTKIIRTEDNVFFQTTKISY